MCISDQNSKIESCHFSGNGIIQLLMLQLIHEKPDHGYQLMQRIQQITGETYSPESGSVYTILRRLEKRGLLQSQWDSQNSNIDRRIYKITEAGELQLKQGLRMITLRRPIFDYLTSYFYANFFKKSEKSEVKKSSLVQNNEK